MLVRAPVDLIIAVRLRRIEDTGLPMHFWTPTRGRLQFTCVFGGRGFLIGEMPPSTLLTVLRSDCKLAHAHADVLQEILLV